MGLLANPWTTNQSILDLWFGRAGRMFGALQITAICSSEAAGFSAGLLGRSMSPQWH
jgi:hypothetical protein